MDPQCRTRLPKDDAGPLKHGVLVIYEILLIYIYACVCARACAHLLAWIINCTRCMVLNIKIVQSLKAECLYMLVAAYTDILSSTFKITEVLLPGLYHHIVVSGFKHSKVLASQNIRYHVLMRYLSESKDL